MAPPMAFDGRNSRLSTGFSHRARRRGLALSPAEEFAVVPGAANGLRLALGAAPSRERLEEGLRSLVSILAGSPASSRSPV